MKRFLYAGLLLALIGFSSVTQATALGRSILDPEAITSFTSDIIVNQNTSLSIKETIEFETTLSKHGIYRYIPFRYDRGDGFNYSARVSDFQVSSEKGVAYQFEKSVENGNIVLKIGDPDVTFSGKKTYVIEYQVENAVQEKEGRASLVWDITGEGWRIPILSSRTRIVSPAADVESASCYTGVFGIDDRLCKMVGTLSNAVEFRYDRQIKYGDNMTVDVVFKEPNRLVFPTPLEKFIKGIRDNFGLVVVGLPGLGMFIWWWRKGRDFVFLSPNVFNLDPGQPYVRASLFGGRQTPFVYEPLKGLTPGEAGVMLDERADNQDVVAEILDLARKKYVQITRLETKKFFTTEVDYLFTQLKSSDKKLSEPQRYLHDALFTGRKTVKVSELKGTFHKEMEKVKELLYASLTAKAYFIENPDQKRITAIIVAIGLNVVTFFVLRWQLELGASWAFIVYFISCVASFVCAWYMPAKSAVGSNLAWQVKGLQETIKRGQWREKIKEKNLFIEEVLPFAVSLGVINQLSRDMEKLNLKPPEYVANGVTNSMAMSSLMNSFSTATASGMSHNPDSSSSGGGFSGGGGGGGGGGSW